MMWLGTYGVSLKGSYRRTDIREMLMKVATPLRPLSADEIPAEPGYCMEMDEGRAFIVGAPLPTQHEATEIQFGLKHHPDVKFRLAMYPNGDKLDESLLVRAKKADAEMSATFMQGVTTLRNGPRTVNALPGEEIVEGVREGFVRTQSMRWETLGKIRDPLYPMINLEGKTGYKGYKHTDSSLSDAQLLKLWDRIVNSIRLRTTSPARHSEAPPPGHPWARWPSPAGPARRPAGGSAPTKAPRCSAAPGNSSARTSPCRRSCCRANPACGSGSRARHRSSAAPRSGN
jgi:hypothetical protein